jgi:hypothetical protein
MRFKKQQRDIMHPALWVSALVVLLVGVISGCASQPPARFIDGVGDVTIKHKSRDAKAQRVDGWPSLRVDAVIRQHLDAALGSDDAYTARSEALAFLDKAHSLATRSTMNELDRLSPAGWDELVSVYFNPPVQADSEAREKIKALYLSDTQTRYWFLRRGVESAKTADAIHDVLNPLAQEIEKPVKLQGKLSRTLSWAVFAIPSTLAILNIQSHENRGDLDTSFESAVRYSLDPTKSAPPDGADELEWDRLLAFAPTIVLEEPKDVTYDRSSDRIGRVVAPDRDTVEVIPSDPTVYAYTRSIRIDGNPHTQLTYTYWFPEHPELKSNDPEAGHTDGLTLRLTLNQREEPIAFETLYNCGCYHRVYPSDQLEADAARAFGKPDKGKQFSIERRVPWKFDTIVPKVVEMHGTGSRPVIRNRAGWHGIVNVAMDEQGHEDEVVDQVRYTLRPYDDLEQLTTPDGQTVSMFYDNGLVKEAQRPEGVFFTPAGLLSSGQPRQRGTQMIHWDHYDFDDPELLMKLLRLPDPSNSQSVATWTGHP